MAGDAHAERRAPELATRDRRRARRLGAFLALLELELGPDAPRTFRGWVLLLVLGPPAYLALAWLGER